MKIKETSIYIDYTIIYEEIRIQAATWPRSDELGGLDQIIKKLKNDKMNINHKRFNQWYFIKYIYSGYILNVCIVYVVVFFYVDCGPGPGPKFVRRRLP